MPSARKHLKWARTHLSALEAMQEQVELFSWSGVVAFYVAHQLAHTVFACSDFLDEQYRNPENHSSVDHYAPGTNYVIKRHFRQVESAYLDLYSMSCGIRYGGQPLYEAGLTDMLQTLGEVARWARTELVQRGKDIPHWLTQLAATPSAEPEETVE